MAAKKPSDNPILVLEKILGHAFKDKSLLIQAITHPSLEGEANYQRLEFLGDRVVGLAVAGLVFAKFGDDSEGKLSRRQAALVRKETLCQVAIDLGVAPLIRMTETTLKTGGKDNASILSDVIEALVGALYIDGGFQAAKAFVEGAWRHRLEDKTAAKDPKSGLQEWAQGRAKPLPRYETVERSGPDHAPSFSIKVSVEGLGDAVGSGTSKRIAETKAAEKLLKKAKKYDD